MGSLGIIAGPSLEFESISIHVRDPDILDLFITRSSLEKIFFLLFFPLCLDNL